VAEDVVEHVRLFQVVELLRLADELAGGEAAVRQMVEEHVIGNEAGNGDDLPAGVLRQHVAQAPEVRNLVGADGQCLHARDEFIAGAAGQELRLALEERLPDAVLCGGVVVPALVDRPVGALGSPGIAGGQAVLGGFLVLHHGLLLGNSAYAWSAVRARSMSRCVSPSASCVVRVMSSRL
jgi:hypothetical protein